MIKKITKLKNFGIFQNFTWGALDDFKDKNLIYGWNYSGKTTLSKFFQILEFKDKSKYFSSSEFEFTCDNNGASKTINQNSLADFPFQVKVFNSEYIKRIFIWDAPQNGFNAISFYLGDPAGNLKTKIANFEKENERLVNIRDNRYKKFVEEFESYSKQNGKFSEKAKDIRDNYLTGQLDQNKLNKSHIKDFADLVKSNLNQYILSQTEKEQTKADATAVNKYERQTEQLTITQNLTTLSAKVKSILEDSAPKSISFPELDSDPLVFDWVQKGISLHVGSKECKFCTKTLPENRIYNLNSYYSKKVHEIQNEISNTNALIAKEREGLKIALPDKKRITDTFQSEYELAVTALKVKIAEYAKQLEVLETDLKNKNTSLFVSLPATQLVDISLDDSITAIETCIKKHNNWFDKFEEIKQAAIEKLLKHYVAEYLQSENYNNKEASSNNAKQIIGQIDSKIQNNKLQIDSLNAQLSDKVKGQTELNDILEILLHRKDIRIEIKNDKFTLERSGHPATDLSEGEKSAIAFSYFLTEIKALRDDNPSKLPKTIIFIDDPISSLDSNHIFQVRSLLKDFFKTEDFAQLFISTHNFEFFSIMYDSKIFSHTKKEVNRPLYFIKRDQTGNSSIDKMPRSFSDYKSEYVGLFHILKDFNESSDKNNFPYLLLLPNALRRFVELYTLSKYPGNNDSTVDQRVEIVFKSNEKPHHNIKLLNWFSHQNQFEKLQQHDDKLTQICDAINDLIEYLKKEDDLHWRGLNGEANTQS